MKKICVETGEKLKIKRTHKPLIKVALLDLDDYGESAGLATEINLGEDYVLYWLSASDGDNEYPRAVNHLSVEEIALFITAARKLAVEHGCRFAEPDDEFYERIEECDRTEEDVQKIKALILMHRLGEKMTQSMVNRNGGKLHE